MHVDKARCDDTPAGIDLVRCTTLQRGRYSGNASPTDSHIRRHTWGACAVDYRAMSDQQIIGHTRTPLCTTTGPLPASRGKIVALERKNLPALCVPGVV